MIDKDDADDDREDDRHRAEIPPMSAAPPLAALMAALITALLALPSPLPPGRYAGHAAAGRVDLELHPDGRAVFGGVSMRWTTDGPLLVLRPPAGPPLRLTVRHQDDGAVLDDSPFGPIRLAPRPRIEPIVPPPPIRPLDWIGGWLHRASGGDLRLRLVGDGTYAMVQTGGDGVPFETRGTWSAEGDRLVLTPAGGAPLVYTARRDADDLVIGGGDLPVEVRFVPDAPR